MSTNKIVPSQKSLAEKSCLEAEKRELEMTVQQLKTDAQEMKHALDHANGDIDKLNDSAEMAKEDMDLQVSFIFFFHHPKMLSALAPS